MHEDSTWTEQVHLFIHLHLMLDEVEERSNFDLVSFTGTVAAEPATV